MNQRPKSFLVLAAKQQNYEVVKFKLEERENSPEETDEEGNNVLHWAAHHCDHKFFLYLWQQPNMPFHLQNQNGETFFDRALLSYRKMTARNIHFLPWLIKSPVVPKVFRADSSYIASFKNLFSYNVNHKVLSPNVELAYRIVCARLGDADSALKVGETIQNLPEKASEALYWFSIALRKGGVDALFYFKKMQSVPALFALLEFYLSRDLVDEDLATINSYFKKLDQRYQEGLKYFFGYGMAKPNYVAARKHFLENDKKDKDNCISSIMAVRCLEKIITSESEQNILPEIATALVQIYVDAISFDNANARLLVLYWLEVFSKQYEHSNELYLALADCYMRESQQKCVDIVLVVYYQQQAFNIYHALETDQSKQNVVKPPILPEKEKEILLEVKVEKKPVYCAYFADALLRASRNFISLNPGKTAVYLDLYAKECMSFYRQDLDKRSMETLGLALFYIASALQKIKKNVELYLRIAKKCGNFAAAISYAKLLTTNDNPMYEKIISIYEKVLEKGGVNYTSEVLLALKELNKKLQDLRIEKYNKKIQQLLEMASRKIKEDGNEEDKKQEPKKAIPEPEVTELKERLPIHSTLEASSNLISSEPSVVIERGKSSGGGLFAPDSNLPPTDVRVSADNANSDECESKHEVAPD